MTRQTLLANALVNMTAPNNAYTLFLKELKERICHAQMRALRAVNTELINMYWDIGKSIVEKQKEHGWGKAIVENLAQDLEEALPGVKGFSASNLWRMRNFYLMYAENEKLAQLAREITWSHNLVVLEKCKDNQQREFYLKLAGSYGWSRSVLVHQIEGRAYERFLLSQTNFDVTVNDDNRHQAKLAVKDSYSFDFLEMGQEYSEQELELKLLNNIRKFLLEMGGDFAFMGNQYKLEVGEESFYIDLLLFHRRLRALVAIELKTTKFKPEYAGKMQFYLTALNETVKTPDEHASIGIIVCKAKDRTTVEYALKNLNSPMGVASYTMKDELPENLKSLLPSPGEIAERLEKMIG
jgi:predicted nuclease of restriction endonuclease-like (RecB) superfamily